MYGVADCNNFFVSCERVFQPELRGVPAVVLSNNDGCVIARSNEAKALGIKMGVPFYQVRHLYEAGKLKVRSSNFVLYGDMSRRIMTLIARAVPRTEEYSIDECFLDLDGLTNVEELCRDLAHRVERCTGVPISIGVAPCKTLAKLASHFAKHYKGYDGCCVIDTDEKREKALQLTDIGDVWGIGRANTAKLRRMGVTTAYDLTRWRPERVRNVLALPGLNTWRELRGERQILLETPVARRSITTSRTFHSSISDFGELRRFVADFAASCATKLRKDGSAARTVTTYICTNRFREDQPQYSNAAKLTLDVATSDLREIVAAATSALESIFRKGFLYKRAGVVLSDIETGAVQANLFDTIDRKKQERLLRAIDQIREKQGPNAVRTAAQSVERHELHREHLSQRYTTDVEEIIVAGKADERLFKKKS